MTTLAQIPVAAYLRVSSDDQRERETIKTQRDAIERFLAAHPEYTLYRYYDDDGVSGTKPMIQRPQGRLLVADASAGKFSKVIVYRSSRLGREEEDKFAVYNLLVENLGIGLLGIMEDLSDRMIFGFHTVIDAYARRQFLADSARGMDRAAREGRYTGGIVAAGYRVEGTKHMARLVPDESIIWGNWSAARLVQRIYEWLALDHKSCRWIAQELNRLGVPTVYSRDGRGVRGKSTQAIWRPGRVRNLVVNSTYKGALQYGKRRSKKSKRTDVINAEIEPLVSPQLWQVAQQVLAENRLTSKNTEMVYLLRGVMKCGLCGLSFCGSKGRPGVWWYRCNGYLVERGATEGRCAARSIRNTDIEPQVWHDIESLLRNPGKLVEQLRGEAEHAADDAAADTEVQRITLQAAIADLESRRQRAIDIYERGRISLEELDQRLDQIDDERQRYKRDLHAIEVPEMPEAPLDPDLLAAIHEKLDEGLTDHQRSEIVRLLVKQITVYTTTREDGKKDVKLVVEYRFSAPRCSHDSNGTGSWRLRA